MRDATRVLKKEMRFISYKICICIENGKDYMIFIRGFPNYSHKLYALNDSPRSLWNISQIIKLEMLHVITRQTQMFASLRASKTQEFS